MKRREFWPALLALVAAPKALLGLKNREAEPCDHFRCAVCPDSVYCCRCCGFEHEPRKEPYCCHVGCDKDAEFSVHGSSGHFEDVTETCAEHVGALLGTPTWLKKENEHWVVYPIAYDG